MLFCSPFAASAQEVGNQAMSDRLDQLEQEVMVLQRQVARSGNSGDENSAVPPTDAATGTDAASMQVQLGNMQDEIRKLRGSLEENQFQVKQLNDKLDKLQKDTEKRLSDMSSAQPAAAAPKPGAPLINTAAPEEHIDTSGESHEIKEGDIANAPEPGKTTAGSGVLEKPSGTENFDSPRDEYNYAFRMLNQTQYDDAAKYFKKFISDYPKDPLIGNAYYWLGQTYYTRHDYVKAADNFRQGFEVLPGGPKAADNLLMLSMSLSATNKDKEACVVLGQISVKFKDSEPSVVKKAQAEYNRIGCK